VDNAQALAEGEFGRDGVFHAKKLQAKCASKYAPADPNAPGAPGAPGTKTPAPAAAPVKTASVGN
jgi:cytochrome c-type biogenesis protein CcmE